MADRIRVMCPAALLAVLAAANPSHVHSQGQLANLEIQRALVALVHIERPGLPAETASAFVIGRSANNLYLVTAYHAISAQGPNNSPPTRVAIQWYSSPDTINAAIFPNYDAVLDLGVISVPITAGPNSAQSVMRGSIHADVPLHIIGHPAAGSWSVWAGMLSNENGNNGDINHFTYSGAGVPSDGYSGAPIFTSQGQFLGIHIASSATYGIGIKADVIERQLAAWRVPSSLTAVAAEVPRHEPQSFNTIIQAGGAFIDNKRFGSVDGSTSHLDLRIDGQLVTRHHLDGPFGSHTILLREGQHTFEFKGDIDGTNGRHLDDSCQGTIQITGPQVLTPFVVLTGKGSVGSILSCELRPSR